MAFMKEKRAEAKPKEVRKSKRYLQCKFAHDELFSFGKTLAEKNALNKQVEADKKSLVKQFDAKLAEIASQVDQISNFLQTGYEYRHVDCIETFGEPDRVKKTVIRTDTGETVEVVPMSPEEMQRVLDFEKEQSEIAASTEK